jgi:hypothetical protein
MWIWTLSGACEEEREMVSPKRVQEVGFIDRSGFWIEDNVLSDLECDDPIEAAPLSLRGRSRAGARHLMSVPAIEAAAKDKRLLRIAMRALGDGAVPFRATLFDKSALANWLVVWHQDTALPLEARNDSAEWGPWSLKAGVLFIVEVARRRTEACAPYRIRGRARPWAGVSSGNRIAGRVYF